MEGAVISHLHTSLRRMLLLSIDFGANSATHTKWAVMSWI
jgi:hypothetical protein